MVVGGDQFGTGLGVFCIGTPLNSLLMRKAGMVLRLNDAKKVNQLLKKIFVFTLPG